MSQSDTEDRSMDDHRQDANHNATEQQTGSRAFVEQVEQGNDSLVREFLSFLRYNKKWWLLPLVGSLLLVGLLSLMATGAAAPFIYTLF